MKWNPQSRLPVDSQIKCLLVSLIGIVAIVLGSGALANAHNASADRTEDVFVALGLGELPDGDSGQGGIRLGSPMPGGLPPLPGEDAGKGDQEVWLDRGSLLALIRPKKDGWGEMIRPVLDSLLGVRIESAPRWKRISVFLNQSQKVQWSERNQVGTGRPYALDWPQVWRFELIWVNSKIRARLLDQESGPEPERLVLQVKTPNFLLGLGERVWLRSADFDLTTGNFQVEAKVAGRLLALVARGQATGRKIGSVEIDWWASISQSLGEGLAPESWNFWGDFSAGFPFLAPAPLR